MATNIVPSLFGLTPQQVRQQQLMQDRQFAQEFAATQATPYAKERALLGATVGSALTRGIAGLFGLRTAEEEKAYAMDSAIKEAMSSLPEGQRNRAAVMSRVSEVLAGNPNFQREAFDASMQAAQFAKEDTEAAADVAYKQGLTDYYGMLKADKAAEQETKKLERQGQVAFGALNSLNRSKDPANQTKIWENALSALEKQGLDVSTLKDLPWEERTNALESIVDSSETSGTRVKAEIASMKQEFAAIQQEERTRHNQAIEALSAQKMQLMQQLSDQRIASAERIALENKLNGVNAQMERLDKTNAWRLQAQETSKVGTKEFDRNIKNYLAETLDLSDKEIAKALPIFNSAYSKYLGTKDENGYPKYDPVTALNLAKQELEGNTKKVYSTFAGMRVPGTTKNVVAPGKTTPIKLD